MTDLGESKLHKFGWVCFDQNTSAVNPIGVCIQRQSYFATVKESRERKFSHEFQIPLTSTKKQTKKFAMASATKRARNRSEGDGVSCKIQSANHKRASANQSDFTLAFPSAKCSAAWMPV